MPRRPRCAGACARRVAVAQRLLLRRRRTVGKSRQLRQPRACGRVRRTTPRAAAQPARSSGPAQYREQEDRGAARARAAARVGEIEDRAQVLRGGVPRRSRGAARASTRGGRAESRRRIGHEARTSAQHRPGPPNDRDRARFRRPADGMSSPKVELRSGRDARPAATSARPRPAFASRQVTRPQARTRTASGASARNSPPGPDVQQRAFGPRRRELAHVAAAARMRSSVGSCITTTRPSRMSRTSISTALTPSSSAPRDRRERVLRTVGASRPGQAITCSGAGNAGSATSVLEQVVNAS